ncbi:MAG: DUF3829 domain-containing protein [Sandaracinaceae bacterium]|nr:DUF3829 domain-containing protein [Myxococcales bacterium]MCB9658694.1 DUF3829 domain-containing protein [Sandaracinaceae bacterium]
MTRSTSLVALTALLSLLSATTALADARSDKLDLYIEVHNMFTTRMRANYDNYAPTLQGLPPDAPCSADSQPGRDMYSTADSTGTIDGYRRRLRRAPRLPQDRLVTAMLDAAAIQVPTWNALYDYYRRRVYTTDQCAQGNADHRRLMAAFEAYFAADAELLTFIDTESRARRARELTETERRHGRNFRFYQVSLMEQVEVMRDLLSAQALDVDALAQAADAMAAGLGEIQPRAEAAPRDVYGDLRQGGYLTFLRRIDTLVTVTRQWVALLRNPNARPNDRERSGGDFERAFRAAIQSSNGVRYSERVH